MLGVGGKITGSRTLSLVDMEASEAFTCQRMPGPGVFWNLRGVELGVDLLLLSFCAGLYALLYCKGIFSSPTGGRRPKEKKIKGTFVIVR